MFYIIKQIDVFGVTMRLLSRSEEYVLLAVWRLSGNAYTLSILEQVSKVTGYEWQIGAIYVPLEKLWKKGYLTKTKGEPTSVRGGRSKVLYELTKEGKKALKEIRSVQETVWEGIPEVVLEEE
jgi:DNA-binding PadR family transcriptional regulator